MTAAAHQQIELERIQAASLAVDKFMQGWYDLKNLPDWNGQMSSSSLQDLSLACLIARAVRFLDAARGCALAGTPQAVKILNRSLYEGYLSALAICFTLDSEWTGEKLGKRFQEHCDFLISHHQNQRQDAIRALVNLHGVKEDVFIQQQKTLAKKLEKAENKFLKLSDPWHPFRNTSGRVSIVGLLDHLWPQDGAPIFPMELFMGDWDDWRDEFESLWVLGSHIVHSTGFSAADYIRPNADAVVHDTRYFECETLLTSLLYAGKTIEAVAVQKKLGRECEMAFHACFVIYGNLYRNQNIYLRVKDPGLTTSKSKVEPALNRRSAKTCNTRGG